MTPIEQAARALARRHGEQAERAGCTNQTPDQWAERNWRDHVSTVRAVLNAIREPTGEMCGDVHDTLLYAVKGEELDTARLVWERMIETALA